MRSVILFCVATSACSVTQYARNQFARDHDGCEPNAITERLELEAHTPDHAEIYEMTGCNAHELYTCASPQYSRHGNLVGGGCSSTRFCKGTGCDKDYAGVAKAIYVAQATCPVERITADFTSKMLPDPPTDIASDPARLKIWRDDQRAGLDTASARGQILVTAKGCGAVGVFACVNRYPDAPACEPLTVTKDAPP